MNPRKISYLLALSIGAGICFSSPIFAEEEKRNPEAAALATRQTAEVMFKDETMAKTADEPFCFIDARIEKYQKGTLIGFAKDGLAEVRIAGRTLYVPMDSFARGSSAVSALEDVKAKEEEAARKKAEEEKKKAEEAKRKAEEEAKRKAEEERRKQEEAAAEKARAEQEAAAKAAAAPVQSVSVSYVPSSGCLTPSAGVFQGPSGKETYYNLPMDGVIAIMRGMGNNDPYWVRGDGVKMLGNYVMVAADLSIRPRGSLVATSLGTGIVCDTGSFAYSNPTQLDIAVAW